PEKITVSGLPNGVRWNSTERKILGIPQGLGEIPLDGRLYRITITASNAAGQKIHTMSLRVRAPHPLPEIQAPSHLPDARFAQSYPPVQVTVTNHPQSVYVEGLPTGMEFRDGMIRGTPAILPAAPIPITLVATNYAGTTRKTFSLKIQPSIYSGTYEAIIDPDPSLDYCRMLGGQINLAVTGTNTYTMQIQLSSASVVRVAGSAITGDDCIRIEREFTVRHPGIGYLVVAYRFSATIYQDRWNGEIRFLDTRYGSDNSRSRVLTFEGYQTSPLDTPLEPQFVGRYTAEIQHSNHVRGIDELWWQQSGAPLAQGDRLPAVSNIQGRASATAYPGSRVASYSWTDRNGLLHMYGGIGIWTKILTPQIATGIVRADHWVFDPDTKLWSFQSGQITGSPRPTAPVSDFSRRNTPGARAGGASWVDGNGRCWLFGGYQSNFVNSTTYYNDLWLFEPASGTWKLVIPGGLPHYGTMGIPSSINRPSARGDAVFWTDTRGNLWLFGGEGYLQGNNPYTKTKNDLWSFDVESEQWTWHGGRDETGMTNVSPDIIWPPGRESPAMWQVPSTGDVLLFGGYTSNIIDQAYPGSTHLGDLWLWKEAERTWTRLHGSRARLPQAERQNFPPEAISCYAWRSADGSFWMINQGAFWRLNSEKTHWSTWRFPAEVSWWQPRADYAGARWIVADGSTWFHGGLYRASYSPDYMFRFGRPELPLARGHLNCSVSSEGTVVWVAVLGDGTQLTGSSRISAVPDANGVRSWLLRQSSSGLNHSAQGAMHFSQHATDVSRVVLSGSLQGVRNLQQASSRPRAFRSGWPLHEMEVSGGSYAAPNAGRSPLALAAGDTANLAFQVPELEAVVQVRLRSDGRGGLSVVSLPPEFSNLTFSISSGVGTFSGTATLRARDAITPNRHISLTGRFQGVIIDGERIGRGTVWWPTRTTNQKPFLPADLTPLQAAPVTLSGSP
ncbi:MAG: kelch motif-containing protein, partial [Prosthecobacter sp.]|nr:kelch motif-containing protein [Prosthecobacter sp.]